ncbi:hypothetical protein V1477_009621 [Vespula maculifrons]|uniref:Uncharacterized protein n=1 Tax=Vespula maculifrons TaxID=7453 RepID=A0ABD2CAD8_VESMC
MSLKLTSFAVMINVGIFNKCYIFLQALNEQKNICDISINSTILQCFIIYYSHYPLIQHRLKAY